MDKLKFSKTKLMEYNMEYMRKSFMNPDISNVTLIIEGKEFPVISYFLAMQSTFFEGLFNGNFEDGKKNKIELKDVDSHHFEILLRLVYFGEIDFKSIDKKNILELCSLAHFFGMNVALRQIENHLIKLPNDDAEEVINCVNAAAIFNMEDLLKTKIRYVFDSQDTYIKEEFFLMFNEAALSILLDSNEWTIKELKILQMVEDWLKIHPTSNREKLLKKIKLRLIEPSHLVRDIRPKKLFTDDQIIEALFNICSDNQRGRNIHGSIRASSNQPDNRRLFFLNYQNNFVRF